MPGPGSRQLQLCHLNEQAKEASPLGQRLLVLGRVGNKKGSLQCMRLSFAISEPNHKVKKDI